jgi:hypothetical protein
MKEGKKIDRWDGDGGLAHLGRLNFFFLLLCFIYFI